jgi:hypothetical protein
VWLWLGCCRQLHRDCRLLVFNYNSFGVSGSLHSCTAVARHWYALAGVNVVVGAGVGYGVCCMQSHGDYEKQDNSFLVFNYNSFGASV